MSQILYEARNLKKYYGPRLALALPFFQLARGELVILTGPNGSGKSTLLRLLAFLEAPSSGDLSYFGRNGARRREVTLLLQEPYLFRETVYRNVTLGLRIRGEHGSFEKAYMDAMRQAGFSNPEDFAKRGPGALSGGERQRVALASRLILQPQALLLDEPTASVDRQSARAIVAAIKNVLARGASAVCATHDLEAMAGLNGRHVCLGD